MPTHLDSLLELRTDGEPACVPHPNHQQSAKRELEGTPGEDFVDFDLIDMIVGVSPCHP